jgi:hypothetical protein
MTTTATNPITGVEYYTEGPLDGKSVKRFVNVINGSINNPSGDFWPVGNGGVHDKNEEFYEYVPFEGAPFDPDLKFVDSENSGRSLRPAIPTPPVGHPQGAYEETRVLKRRSKAELRALAKGFFEASNRALWPQESGYTEKLQYAKEQIVANNNSSQFLNLLQRHERLLEASFHNDARLAQIYAVIEEAGETGNIDDWPFSKMQGSDPDVVSGWVNGIEE